VGDAARQDLRSSSVTRGLTRLPFVGREEELAQLREYLAQSRAGKGAFVFVMGESGVGKTRIVQEVAEEARKAGCLHAGGQAYEVESGYPYAVIADALGPIVHHMDPQALAVATRGTEAELAQILPMLARARSTPLSPDDSDAKTRMLWHFAQFLQRLASRQPVVLTLENLQWADAASLELLHFVGRQITSAPLLIVATAVDEDLEETPALRRITRSLLRVEGVHRIAIKPLGALEVTQLVHEAFQTSGPSVDAFALRLFEQTRGNPFFTEEVLKALVERGELRRAGDRWTGWDADVAQLPATVRDAVRSRLESLSDLGARVAGLMAAVGTPVRLPLLQRMIGEQQAVLGEALHELVRRAIVVEHVGSGSVTYDFGHPIVRGIIYADLGAARARSHHGEVIRALEAFYGPEALQHAVEFAPHLTMAAEYVAPNRAIHYLLAAGRDALNRHANRAADRFLSQALEAIERTPSSEFDDALSGLLVMLARVKHREGAYEEARGLLLRARGLARQHADQATEAAIDRRLGLAEIISGRPDDALPHFDAAEQLCRQAGLHDLLIRTRVSRGTALQALGRCDEAEQSNLEMLPIAEALGDAALQARIHREMVLLYGFRGPASAARTHGEAVLRCAKASGDESVAWSAHWAMAILAGFTGDGEGVLQHQRQAAQLARALNSPLLLALTAEVGIEYASAVGNWADGLAAAEQVLPIARAIAPRTLLPRLLVWTGIMLLERAETARAESHFREAWSLAELAERDHHSSGTDVSVMVPACTGMAANCLSRKAYRHAIEYAERGLAITDRYGYHAWAIHRLLPILCEARIWIRDFEPVVDMIARLREQSRLLDHRLGLAWADAAEALLLRFRDNDPEAATRMVAAATRLETVPFRFHAARLRRNAAQLLALDGRRDDAIEQLRIAHDMLLSMGAERELRGARDQLRELGVRPPQKTMVTGGALTGREREIAELVARHKSNKEIARALEISSRTVSTHLSNIFLKLEVQSRGELADYIRGIGAR
jgi:DNA-binding CsgD family transcriptional regulator